MSRLEYIACTLALCALGPLATAQTREEITAEQVRSIGVDAYVYLYPLVTMDVTRKQFTNIEPGREMGKGPMNTFVNVPIYPPVRFRGVVRPNFDTLYSLAWLDLTGEAQVISVPDTGGRYYLLPMLDMWTDVFASPGWRTTGTRAGNFLVTPPGWSGTVPQGFVQLPAPTPYVWIIGRTKTDGRADYSAVHKVQAGFGVTPLSRWGRKAEPPKVRIDPDVDMKTPPRTLVDAMPAAAFFAYAAELLKLHPPHLTDQPIVARMRQIGIEPGKPFSLDGLAPVLRQALEGAPGEAQALMRWKEASIARVANGWLMNTDTMGVYGNYYLKRAIVVQQGLGANLPEDSVYPMNLADADGKPLDGAYNYRIHFARDALPPVDAFWSITLYDSDGFPVGNRLNRQALSSWMPFRRNADGSLDLYFQHDSPGEDKEDNWLPAPKSAFNLAMRLYAPRPEVLLGKWNPPPVERQP